MAIIQAVDDGKLVDNYSASETEDTSNDMGYDQFLQLLCAEMQYQDPLEPTSNTEYVAQLATFSQMEAMLNMQDSIQMSTTNDLVGKYVLIKDSTGLTSGVAGYVDFTHYENGDLFVSVNGSLYSAADVYEVVDPEYMEAVSLADAFVNEVAKLPAVEDLSTAWEEDLTNLASVYSSMTSYQQSYIPQDAMKRFTELLERMTELKKASGSTDGDTDTNTDADIDTDADGSADSSADSTEESKGADGDAAAGE